MPRVLPTFLFITIGLEVIIRWFFLRSLLPPYLAIQTTGVSVYLLFSISVALGALITTFVIYGKAGLGQLLGRLKPSVPSGEVIWLVVSPLFLIPLLEIICLVFRKEHIELAFPAVVNLWGSSITGYLWHTPIDLITTLFSLLLATGLEEIAWRGFVLPHLQVNQGAFRANLILSLIATATHIVLYPSLLLGAPKIFFEILIIGIILTSIYNSSGGYLLPTTAFHFLINLYAGRGVTIAEMSPNIVSRELLLVLFNPFFFLPYLLLESEGQRSIFIFLYSVWMLITAIVVCKRYGLTKLSRSDQVGNYFLQSE
ncbi:MAG: CPBP family intramembrane glutamic endopeptidase [Pseudanabaenaceae cyanobacterium]